MSRIRRCRRRHHHHNVHSERKEKRTDAAVFIIYSATQASLLLRARALFCLFVWSLHVSLDRVDARASIHLTGSHCCRHDDDYEEKYNEMLDASAYNLKIFI